MPDIVCTAEEDRTKQSFRDECDINRIMARYAKSGVLPDLIRGNPQYGDFSSVADYQSALNIVVLAEEQFASLDGQVRARFGNDPACFLSFCSDPANRSELARMGLLKPELVNQDGSLKADVPAVPVSVPVSVSVPDVKS
ncbi:MAG: internal scaffolding protein [Microvirus sp.]|nr:MAG: internal scaffolding protein [Microvirus sp.]